MDIDIHIDIDLERHIDRQTDRGREGGGKIGSVIFLMVHIELLQTGLFSKPRAYLVNSSRRLGSRVPSIDSKTIYELRDELLFTSRISRKIFKDFGIFIKFTSI